MNAPLLAVPPRVIGADVGAAREREPRHWLWLVLPIWAALYGLLIAVNADVLSHAGWHDPDDQLRLQQVRDLLAGQSWFDITQYRIDAAGGGVAMHWSRLVDLPIAAVILVTRPLFGPIGAEVAALVAVPGLTLLAILSLVAWIASRVLSRGVLPMALLAVAFAVPVIVQVLPGRIDHHGWQIALALAAMAGFLVADARRGGWITGGALAGWMAISFEGVPMAAWIVAVLALGALLDPLLRARLVSAMQTLALGSLALFAATRGLADLANHCDAIAPAHLGAFLWGAAAIWIAHVARPDSRMALLIGLAVAGSGAVTILAGAAPQCAGGSFDMLDPVVRTVWYDNVREGKPILTAEWHLAAQYALPPLVGLIATLRLAGQETGPKRRWWLFYALVLTGAIAIGLLVARASAISGVLAAVPLGWLLAGWMDALRRPANPVLRTAELLGLAALIAVVLLPVVPVVALERLLDVQSATQTTPASTAPCTVVPAKAILAALPPGGILAPLDMGPDILLQTNRAVLATGHHRGARAMRLTIDAFSGSAEEARAVMAARGLRYLAICPELSELAQYRKRAPDGLAARLDAGNVPAWLVPVPLPEGTAVRMWRRVD